jgi:hypothetical protein
MNPREFLAALRNASESGDWNGCRSAATALGSLLAPRQLVDIACVEVKRRLPAFLRTQPGTTWPERILAGIEVGEAPALAMLPIEDYDGPGANSYHTALEMLMEAALHRDDQAKSVTSAVDAIARAIMAGLAERWGSRNRERWDRWYESASSDLPMENEDVLRTLLDMKNDPEVSAMRRQSWMDVADAFERTLRA